MLAIIGALVVILSVIGGYAFTHGPFSVLFQPAELIIILGAAIGTILLGTPPKVLRHLTRAIPIVFKGSPYTKDTYLELLMMQFEVFSKVRKGGLLAMEEDVGDPYGSPTFKNYPRFIRNQMAVLFFCDSMKLLIDGTDVAEVDHIMQSDLSTLQEEGALPAGVLQKVGDALPGLGIVAAVLGIIVTMQKLDGPPEELGQHVAAALVGTFLGILVSYGFFQPLGAAVEALARDEHKYLQCMMVGLSSSTVGSSPRASVEQARRVIYAADRPSTEELAAAINQIKATSD
ncbi:MAG TPA: flagellar motor stator protein MotA [Candidatus Krumholzibacteria bacterium]|nr:flagellar motor stator protein MotA [Candidatus Krumholzibacteria bacterium]HPD70254.1 flagellar motor stator protein MotA [Candidatus Krumholzibacteria bacterium]HRY40046.1 flagellar motor stator protein MotA [Candidatus Krumholzibacteria bacterium]